MRLIVGLMTLTFGAIVYTACNKSVNSTVDCFTNQPTTRQLTNKQATVKSAGGRFYNVEQGSIDSKLNPCNLKQEFQVNDLQVVVSGDVKLTTQVGLGPCCTENFVITKITR